MRRLTTPLVLALVAVGLISGITLAFGAFAGPAGSGGTSYPVQLNLQSDICQHDQYIFPRPPNQPPPHNLKLQLNIPAPGMITISGPAPWISVTGPRDPETGNFSAQGSGTVAGYTNVDEVFNGNAADGVLTGKYTFGFNGELPDCNGQDHPAVYQVKPKPATATQTPTATRTLPPTPIVPLANGICFLTEHNGHAKGETWEEHWKCSEQDANTTFNRVDVSIGAPSGQPIIDEEDEPFMTCQAGHLWIGHMQFKGRQTGVNAEEPQRPDHEIWSFQVPEEDPCAGGVDLYLNTIGDLEATIKAVAFSSVTSATPTATPQPTVAVPPPNGECGQIRLDVMIGNYAYDEWKCTEHDINFAFNRVDVAFPTTGLSQFSLQLPPIFRCQSGLANQQVNGAFKGFREDVNPNDPSFPDDEIWSAEFSSKCTEGIDLFMHWNRANANSHIKGITFSNVSHTTPVATPTPNATTTQTPPQATPTASATNTPLPPPTATRTPTPTFLFPTPIKLCGDVNDDRRVNSQDAAIIEQYDAGLLTPPILARIPNLPSGDTNFDGRINSIDATIDLQIDAHLLDHCGQVM